MTIHARTADRGPNEALEFSGGVGLNFQTGPSNRRGAPIDSGDRRSLAPYGSEDARGKAEQRVTDRYRRLLRAGETTAARAVLATAYDLGLDLDGEISRTAADRPGSGTNRTEMSREENARLAAEKHDKDYDAYRRALHLDDDADCRGGLGLPGR